MSRPSRETLIRYFKGESLPHEREPVELYLAMDTDREYVESCIAEVWDELGPHARMGTDERDLEAFKQRLDRNKKTVTQLPPEQPDSNGRPLFPFPSWMQAAAAAVLLVAGAVWGIHETRPPTSGMPVAQLGDNILPGSDKALLTLSDGSTVSLSEAGDGQIAEQQGLRIEKTDEGEIVYRANGRAATDAHAVNSVSTPNGGQYRVVLPDGSTARLNAASSLTYPVHFSGGERRVRMTGEVYFEIAKTTDSRNKRIPFFVETAGQEIQVLGTAFNVNTYPDEPHETTTLVEGSVRLKSPVSDGYTLLHPGQQALVGNTVSVAEADLKKELAWVNGNFIFKREALHSILRKISRWYDIEVECPPEPGDMKFTGKVSRSQPLSAVVNMVSATGKVQVELKGRRFIVKE